MATTYARVSADYVTASGQRLAVSPPIPPPTTLAAIFSTP